MSMLIFGLDPRFFHLTVPRFSCCHFLTLRSVLLRGEGLASNAFHSQDEVKKCEMEREKIDVGLVCRHTYEKNKQTCEQLNLGNLVFGSFRLWVF